MSRAEALEQNDASGASLSPRRIHIIGSCGSGKTVLAQNLAARLRLPHLELDALRHQPNWTELPNDEMIARVEALVARDRWVTDGNYSFVRPVIWTRADTVVWLDYSFPLTFARLLRRTLRRSFTGEVLWNGNRERPNNLLKPIDDNILWWFLKTYRSRRRQFPPLFADPAFCHIAFLRHRSPRETDRWLARLSAHADSLAREE